MNDDRSMAGGRAYWRSLEELAESPELEELLHREFPEGASEAPDGITRRTMLGLMSASLSMAGLAACRRPEEAIVPYVDPPEQIVPGIAQHYATTMPLLGSAVGLVVESHEGRPTKIEGNREHPSSRGKAHTWAQASILSLYDPDRSRRVLSGEAGKTWDDFVAAWKERFEAHAADRGAGLAILAEPFSSPTQARLRNALLQRFFPEATWVTWAPAGDESLYEGLEAATGEKLQAVYHTERARVIVSVDADILLTESESLTHNRGFADGRRVTSPKDDMNRLYAVEALYSVTGGMADHRLRLRPHAIPAFLTELARALAGLGLPLDLGEILPAEAEGIDGKWVEAVARDLMAHRGESLVIAGHRLPPEAHTVALAINRALGNLGRTVSYRERRDATVSRTADLTKLVERMRAGEIETLVVFGGNPAYSAPADLGFVEALAQVATSIHVGSHVDETATLCTWHVPLAHYLESWDDTRAADGTLSVVQPLIEPLFKAKAPVEVLALLATNEDRKSYDLVRETWQGILGASSFEAKWRTVLHDGLLPDSALPTTEPGLRFPVTRQAVQTIREIRPGDGLEILFYASPSVLDGRWANNGWLQELPDPLSKLTWGNAALLSPATARQLGVENEGMLRLRHGEHEIEAPAWIVPGWADATVGLALGYGRTAAGRVGNGVGVNAYALRTTAAPWSAGGLQVERRPGRQELASTQDHGRMEGRPLAREATLETYREEPKFAAEAVEHPPLKSPWQEHIYDEGYQWGMSIDLNACTGCNACTIACQSENNIPIVGKDQVRRGREMHWIRLDRYFSGDEAEPDVAVQPVPCQQCENAPCEQVCPVAATVHDSEGLNVMVYNRCIGTRYCSNNCPYKVRRFNFYNFTWKLAETVKMAQNPDVTVRSRGVMEKCTYCTQRINEGKLRAKKEGREIRDGEVQTACQQTCPTDAIVFGNIRDPESRVAKARGNERSYAMLAELNNRPRTTYLARLRNPNPELES